MQSNERHVERVTLQLRQMIMAGEFSPGSRVAEVPLAERLGVSRTPVRLALEVLEREGLVLGSPRRGFVVREITVNEITQAYDVRGALEGLAARRAIERGISAATRALLEECVAEGERLLVKGHFSEADTRLWSAMNARFHAAIVDASANKPLADAIAFNARLPMVAAGAIAFNSKTLDLAFLHMQINQGEHRDIVNAILAGQAVRAQALLEEHSYKSREHLKVILERVRGGDRTAEVPGLRLVVG
jgi:GntR family transcriptional regulator of vanillate catabolism